MKATFIGGGNMGSAIVGALIARGELAGELRIIEPSSMQRERLRERVPGVALHEVADAHALAGSDIVVLAVKPQQIAQACRELASHLAVSQLVLSIAAGVRCADLSRWLGGHARIVRAMPNTPALVGAGISVLYAAREIRNDTRIAEDVLRACGETLWCEREEDLDAVTAVSGSGPAYVFYFLEALEQAAIDLGLSPPIARRLAYATFDGSMRLARESSESPARLRENVTSKGGTTARALETMDATDMRMHFIDAVNAAATRAAELGDAFGKA
ncbi:MAG TPA: pyrroline-5-carboxylate reductase [Casimicrobiaceae bacterium]|nr:pyrroline-5-carboxylate reductase [Casimicrobiaceae bacterium]